MANRKLYVLIAIALVLSYLVTTFLSKEVFVADSPQIRPDAVSRIARLANPTNLVASIAELLKGSSDISTKQEIAEINRRTDDASFFSVAKGVQAKSKGNVQVIQVTVDDVEWQEYTFNVSGKTVKIRVPKGTQPPTQQELENNN